MQLNLNNPDTQTAIILAAFDLIWKEFYEGMALGKLPPHILVHTFNGQLETLSFICFSFQRPDMQAKLIRILNGLMLYPTVSLSREWSDVQVNRKS